MRHQQLTLFGAGSRPRRRLSRDAAGLSKETRPGPERLLADLVARGLDREHLGAAAALVLELDNRPSNGDGHNAANGGRKG